ncbi:M24 family metallopeptidase [Marinobacterium rhizophilum]|uniref:Aminopeptidase P family protein n=1 Tax=Marinobacterium rhizophilum TaxID=420402 RepID=A0ABY5HKY3_9GAMM|nr:Xaa-Pro peptidase family protein [Marinobacterium rhizophilum]UTW13048.1 aminopeptidase P family protein [Marinobacterium rhizophilum]
MKNRKIFINSAGLNQPLKDPVSRETLHSARAYRLQRVREQLIRHDCAAVLLYDPINIRYATDSSNMQVWTAHNAARYAMVFAAGPVIMWEFHNCEHLCSHLEAVDEIRSAINWAYFGAGPRVSEKAAQWAAEIADLLRHHGGGNMRLAVDKMEPEGIPCLVGLGVTLLQGQPLLEQARAIKSVDELELIKWTIQVCERGIRRMADELRPGMTENELWAWLHFENIRHGGEWIETRLLASGPRTNPWMQESSNRVMREGEIIGFDTDMIGPYGYCADISRVWTVGHVQPTPEQRRLYRTAYEQIHHNMALLKPGMSFAEFTAKCWRIPKEFYQNRYCCVAHGVGMADEYPAIAHVGDDWQRGGYDGVFEENMTICIESCIAVEGGKEGVKLEEQVLITRDGCVPLSSYPFEDDWLR